MEISIILILLIIVALFEHNSTSDSNHELIYNGVDFKPEDYPYVMFIRCKSQPGEGLVRFTGSIISELFILTSAQCTYGRQPSDLDVTQGTIYYRNEFHKVSKFYQHEDFDPEAVGRKGDISVLRLQYANRYIKQFVKIGGSPDDFAYSRKLSCQMFGFGITGEKNIIPDLGYMMTNDVVHGKTACQLHEDPMIKNTWEQYICLVPDGNSTLCLTQDIGGPMVCNGIQYGIYSFSYSFVKYGGTKCGDPHQQQVFTFIHYHLDWLNKIIYPKKKKKKKKKKEKSNSGNLLKPHHTLHKIVSILLYNIMLNFI